MFARIVCAIAVGLFLAAIPAAGQARPFALDDLKRLVDIQEPQISPDGSHVAVVVITPDFSADAYVTRLELIDVGSGARSHLTNGRSGVNFPRWSRGGDSKPGNAL